MKISTLFTHKRSSVLLTFYTLTVFTKAVILYGENRLEFVKLGPGYLPDRFCRVSVGLVFLWSNEGIQFGHFFAGIEEFPNSRV